MLLEWVNLDSFSPSSTNKGNDLRKICNLGASFALSSHVGIMWYSLPGIQSNPIQLRFSSVQFCSLLFPSINYLFKNTNCNKQMNLCCLEMAFAGRSGEKILILKKKKKGKLIYYVNN